MDRAVRWARLPAGRDVGRLGATRLGNFRRRRRIRRRFRRPRKPDGRQTVSRLGTRQRRGPVATPVRFPCRQSRCTGIKEVAPGWGRRSGSPEALITGRSSSTTSLITFAVCSGLAAGVERFSFATILPCSSTTPAATFVPPTSTPIVRATDRSFLAGARPCLLLRVSARRRGRAVRIAVRRRIRVLWRHAGTRPGRDYRLERVDRVLHDRGENVPGAGQVRAETRARVLEHTRGPAQRAPFALGRLPARRLIRGTRPHIVPAVITVAERLAEIAAHVPAEAAGAGSQQPALEVAQRVAARLP